MCQIFGGNDPVLTTGVIDVAHSYGLFLGVLRGDFKCRFHDHDIASRIGMPLECTGRGDLAADGHIEGLAEQQIGLLVLRRVID